MKFLSSLLLSLAIIFSSSLSWASEWIRNVNISQLSAYQHSTGHFVWLSSGLPADCQHAGGPALSFSEASPGGKALMSVLTTAVVAKASVDVHINGCDILEVYLR